MIDTRALFGPPVRIPWRSRLTRDLAADAAPSLTPHQLHAAALQSVMLGRRNQARRLSHLAALRDEMAVAEFWQEHPARLDKFIETETEAIIALPVVILLDGELAVEPTPRVLQAAMALMLRRKADRDAEREQRRANRRKPGPRPRISQQTRTEWYQI